MSGDPPGHVDGANRRSTRAPGGGALLRNWLRNRVTEPGYGTGLRPQTEGELGAVGVTGLGVVPPLVPGLVPFPPMFGQLWVDLGVVVPPFGVLVAPGAGVADGSGLAANATAAPPTMRSIPDRARVATARRTPPNDRSGCGSGAGGMNGVAGHGSDGGWVKLSIGSPGAV